MIFIIFNNLNDFLKIKHILYSKAPTPTPPSAAKLV
jgi:hypothetical protein